MRKVIAIVFFVLAGLGVAGAFVTINKAAAPGIATYVGAFLLPALFVWWGWIALHWRQPKR